MCSLCNGALYYVMPTWQSSGSVTVKSHKTISQRIMLSNRCCSFILALPSAFRLVEYPFGHLTAGPFGFRQTSLHHPVYTLIDNYYTYPVVIRRLLYIRIECIVIGIKRRRTDVTYKLNARPGWVERAQLCTYNNIIKRIGDAPMTVGRRKPDCNITLA